GKTVLCLLAAAGAQECAQQRGSEHAEHRTVGLGEAGAAAVQRDADDPVIGAGQADSDLVLDRNAAEEFGVQTQAMEPLPAEEVADLDRLAGAGGTVVPDERMFVDVRDRKSTRLNSSH